MSIRLAAGALAGLVLAGGCASTGGDQDTQSWRKVNQSANRFAVFVSEPGSMRDGLVTFRMRYVYMPGEVKHENRDVAWQEYHAMTVDCARNAVRVGARTRYAPDGSVIAQDDDQEFGEILWGTAADDAARAKCEDKLWVGDVTFPNTSDWMDAARQHIAKTPPPKRS